MKESNRNILKSSFRVGLATFLSRILGLFRVILEAKFLGGGALASAWQLAFMVPNMFRRFLGEGALGTAMVPLISHNLEKHGSHETRRHLSAIFLALGLLLAALIIAVSGLTFLLRYWVERDYEQLALKLIPLLMPYAFFMCFVGVVSSVLNSVKVFFLPALGALLLNIAIISCLLFVIPGLDGDSYTVLRALSFAVLIAGAVQLFLMLVLLYHYNMFPARIESLRRGWHVVYELFKLTLPGLIGASSLQLSFLTDRLIAMRVGPNAVPALSYSDRIIYLPISIIGLSLGSVLLPTMSRAAAREDFEELFDNLRLALRCILYLCIPIAVFTVIFREPLLQFLYLRGKFDLLSLRETAWAMLFYACGIPFFAAVKILVPAFYARKDMRTPLRVSVFCFFVNLILSIVLAVWLRQGGIALATVIAAVLNNALLLFVLRKEFGSAILKLKILVPEFIRGLVISSGLSLLLVYFYPSLPMQTRISWLPRNFIALTVCGTAFCIAYLLLTLASGSTMPRTLLTLFKRGPRK